MGRARARIIFGCFALVLGIAAWVGLAPTSLGGGLTYATTSGTSMEPRLHRGDLVVLRSSPSYRVGDVVGYHDPNVNHLVLHRIVGGTAAGFTLKGDNNDFLDPSHPSAEEITGRLVARVPAVGGFAQRFRSPGSAAVLVGAIVLVPVRSRRRRRSGAGERPPTQRPGISLDARRSAVAGFAVLALGLAALAGYAYSRPTTAPVVVADAYEQAGTFSYYAAARKGAAYPDGFVRTGEAVFARLSRAVTISFDYRLTSRLPTDVAVRGTLDAVVSDGRGWSRVLPLAPARAARAGDLRLSGRLQLDRLRALTRAFERETGTRGTEYSVSVRARTSGAGTVDGSQVIASFAPTLALQTDGSRLALASSPTGEPPAFRSRRPGTITRDAPASIGLGPVSLPVHRARAVGLLGFEAAFGAALLLGLPLLVLARRSEVAAIRMRLGGRLVEVAELPWTAPGGCVDLESMSDLVRLAGGADLPIMVVERDGGARYGIVRGEVLYRYATRAPAQAPRQAAAAVVA